MHTEKREDPLVEMGYEIRDINMKAIKQANLYFFAFAIGSGIIGYIMFILMNPGVKAYNEGKVAERRLPLDKKTPLVQSNMMAKTDMMLLRQMEDMRLVGSASKKRDGKFTIPIATAMRILADSPRRSTPPAATPDVRVTAPNSAAAAPGAAPGAPQIRGSVPPAQGGQP